MKKQNGFTLVELAIVMTIIGLLIGGILKGQELLQNARVTATIAQVKAIEAATTTFRDRFDAYPGDMSNASTRLTGCTATCNPSGTAPAFGTGAVGDGIVGVANWGNVSLGANAWTTQTNAAVAVANSTWGETTLFWVHLTAANLLGGVTMQALNFVAPAWGVTHPAAKTGGGFIAGHGDGSVPPGSPLAYPAGPTGLILVLVQTPAEGTTATMITAGGQPLTPTRAAQMDRKMDDGTAATGNVQGYGKAASCFGAANSYDESVTSSDCGLMFQIQG